VAFEVRIGAALTLIKKVIKKVLEKLIEGAPGKANGAVSTWGHRGGRRSGLHLRPFVE
jgi:hypothetical protein